MARITINAPKVFWLVGDVTFEKIAELKKCLYKCEIEGSELICMISSNGGAVHSVADLRATLKQLNVHFTTVGYGLITSIAAAIFAMGDDRALMDGATLIITEVGDNVLDIYKDKTMVSDEIWKEKVVDSPKENWDVRKNELRKYGFVNQNYSTVARKIVSAYEEELPPAHPYFFSEEFDVASATKTISYIYQCAAYDESAIMEICSAGGSASFLRAIIDTLRATKVDLVAIGGGVVGSAAAILFLTAKVRALKEGTHFMLHKIYCITADNVGMQYDDLIRLGIEIRADNVGLERLWNPNTSISLEEYHKKVEGGRDWVPSEEEWKKYGIITIQYDELHKLILEVMKSE